MLTSNQFEGCSASVIAFENYNKLSNGMVLTNGHCIGMGSFMEQYPADKEVFANKPAKNTDIYLYSRAREVILVKPKRLVYGTMTGSDIGIFELPKSYAELESLGVYPIIVEKNPAVKAGDILQMPSSYWKTTYSCMFETNIDQVQEGPWTWKKSVRFSVNNCKLAGGASGSPLLNSQGRLLGVINTVNENGESCTLNNPCEVQADGSRVVQAQKNYGFFLSALYDCRNEAGDLDFGLAGCSFLKP